MGEGIGIPPDHRMESFNLCPQLHPSPPFILLKQIVGLV